MVNSTAWLGELLNILKAHWRPKIYSRLAQKSPRLGEKRMMSGARLDEVSVLRALLQRVFFADEDICNSGKFR